MSIKDVFNYIRPLWENRYNQVSVRAVLAIALTINFMLHITNASSDALFTEAGLIAALLGLTAFQNIQDKRIETDLEKTKVNLSSTDRDSNTNNDPDNVTITTINK
jgi:hypothetical protein